MTAPGRVGRGGTRREADAQRTEGPAALRSPAEAILGVQRTAGNRSAGALLQRRAAPRSRRILARRRVPPMAELERILFDPAGGGRVDATDAAAHRAGLDRLIAMSRQEMTAAEQARVNTERRRGLTAAQWGALSASERSTREGEAVVRVRADTRLGDPLLIDTGPRPGTRDAAHLTSLVNSANRIFDRIATSAVDAHITQVFGAANLVTAKARYANARTRMNALHVSGHIVTDRSAYNAEVFLGGLTNDQQISIAPGVMDNPTSRESIITFIHESMHAGNPGVVGDDGGYIDRRVEFVRAQEAAKLGNAAHFEVVPRRMLGMGAAGLAYPGVTFTPGVLAPPVVGGPPPPPPPVGGAPVVSVKQQAIEAAYLAWKEAWTTALNLHMLFVRNLRTPADWVHDIHAEFGLPAAARFADVLPFWSKVEGLTVHNRAGVTAASADPSTQPVTQIDVALSEAVTRQLARGMFAMPESEAAANALEATATAAERAAATTVPTERDLLIQLTARDIGTVTGNPARDVFVVNELGPRPLGFPDMLQVRGPGAFPH
jgi:hypothetical protein